MQLWLVPLPGRFNPVERDSNIRSPPCTEILKMGVRRPGHSETSVTCHRPERHRHISPNSNFQRIPCFCRPSQTDRSVGPPATMRPSHYANWAEINTDMRRLTTGIRSEKCVVRRFRRCANVIQCTYTNLDNIAYCTPRLYGIAYCSQATNLYSMLLYWILQAIVTQW